MDKTLNLDSKIYELNNISRIKNQHNNSCNKTEQEIVDKLNKTICGTKTVDQFKDQV